LKIVIDTNILCKGFQDKDIDIVTMILNFRTNEKIAIGLDLDGLMLGEYTNEVGKDEFYRKWITHFTNTNRIHYQDGKLQRKIKNELLKRGFHEESDQTFVAVSLKLDKVIITEDSDYGKGKEAKAKNHMHVLDYMTNQLGMKVFDSKEANEEF